MGETGHSNSESPPTIVGSRDDEVEKSLFPKEFYLVIAKTVAAAGWADPMMDVYGNCESSIKSRSFLA